MTDKNKGYISQEENEEEEENEDDDNNDYETNKRIIIKKKENNNNNYKNDKSTETKINIVMNDTEKDKLINQLKNELKVKDNKINTLTKTNYKLQQSLEKISKRIDEQIFNEKTNKNFFEKIKHKKTSIKNNTNDTIKEKELNNAINMIKILKNDNKRLQDLVDNYEKDNKLNNLEYLNKQKMNENIDLEKQIKDLKSELINYKSYIKKAKEYEKQIEILNKENRVLKDNIKSLNDQLYKRNQNFENEGTDNKNNISTKRKRISLIKLNKSSSQRNIFNKFQFKININPQNKNNNKTRNIYSMKNTPTIVKNQNLISLPTINSPKNNISTKKSNSLSKLTFLKKNYTENIEDILQQFFSSEEVELIKNKIFRNNSEGLEAFKIKLCIINKSKESLINKYNNEIKKYKERLASTQEQIDYLNNKIRQLEINCQVLNAQKNEDVIKKKFLQKKIKNLEKNLEEKNNILKLGFMEDNNIDNENRIDVSQNENEDKNTLTGEESDNKNKTEKNEFSENSKKDENTLKDDSEN